MHGFSPTLYSLNTEDEKLLAMETPLRAWPGLKPFTAPRIVPLPDGLPPSATSVRRYGDGGVPHPVLQGTGRRRGRSERTRCPSRDGDTGTTLAAAARALIRNIGRLPLSDHTQLYSVLGQELSQTMGGSSGVLLAIFFAAARDAASGGHSLMGALKVGLARMQEVGGAQPGDRTMIDALQSAVDALPQGLPCAARAAREGANRTATMSGHAPEDRSTSARNNCKDMPTPAPRPCGTV